MLPLVRAIILFAFVVGLAYAGAKLADVPGTVLVTLGTREYEMPVGGAAFALLIAFFVLFVVIRLLTLMISSPKKIQNFMGRKRQERGYTALSRGMLAVAAGDASEAQRYAKRAQSLLDDPPLTLLLAAQAAQLGGKEKAAEGYFTAMLENADTEFLGLRGLFMQASREGNQEAALAYVNRAYELRPNTPWVVNARLDLQSQTGRWLDASDTLGHAQRQNLLSSDVERRRRGILLTAQAKELAEDDPDKALDKTMAALRLVPGLVPAAVLAGDLLKTKGRLWKAAGILETAWSQTPHPDIARLYRDLKPDETPEQRVRRMQILADMNPSHPESRLLMAALQLDLRDHERARETLQDVAKNFPTARVCSLMAEIEQQATGDPFRAREWLSRVPHAPRDASWICDNCQNAAPNWTPVCPSCGAFDTLVWRKPVTEILESLPAPSTELADMDSELTAELERKMDAAKAESDAAHSQDGTLRTGTVQKMGTQLKVTRNRAARSVQVMADQIGKSAAHTRERLKKAVAILAPGAGANGSGASADRTESASPKEGAPVDLSAVTPPEPEIFQSPRAPDDPGPEGEVFEDRKAGPRPPQP